MPSPTNSRREEWQEGILIALAIPLIGALAFLVLGCFRLFSVPSNSMFPELGAGSYVVVSRLTTGFNQYTFDYFPLPMVHHWPKRETKRGDVVVFRHPADHNVFYIKRVVGLPGDTVSLRKGRLIINGKVVPRDEAGKIAIDMALDAGPPAPAYIETLPDGSRHTIVETNGDKGEWDNTQDYTVPPEHVFVLGDNRDNSSDSRIQDNGGIGFVPLDLINGKVVSSFRLPGSGQQ